MTSLVAIPTHNERENLRPLVQDILQAVEADVLVVDTNSPDGTGAQADRLAEESARVHVQHLPRTAGLAEAYVAIYDFMLSGPYQQLVQMDADRSHQPSRLPAMFQALEFADISVGSRYSEGAKLHSSMARKALSWGSNLYTRKLLQLPLLDPTSGFMGFRRNVLEALHFEDLRGRRYGLPVELKYRASRLGFRLSEVPIEYRDREEGRSKLRPRHLLGSAARIAALRWQD